MVGKRKGGVKSGDGRTALRATRHPQIHGSTGVLSSRLETRAAPIQIFVIPCLSDLPIQICAAPSLAAAPHHTTLQQPTLSCPSLGPFRAPLTSSHEIPSAPPFFLRPFRPFPFLSLKRHIGSSSPPHVSRPPKYPWLSSRLFRRS